MIKEEERKEGIDDAKKELQQEVRETLYGEDEFDLIQLIFNKSYKGKLSVNKSMLGIAKVAYENVDGNQVRVIDYHYGFSAVLPYAIKTNRCVIDPTGLYVMIRNSEREQSKDHLDFSEDYHRRIIEACNSLVHVAVTSKGINFQYLQNAAKAKIGSYVENKSTLDADITRYLSSKEFGVQIKQYWLRVKKTVPIYDEIRTIQESMKPQWISYKESAIWLLWLFVSIYVDPSLSIVVLLFAVLRWYFTKGREAIPFKPMNSLALMRSCAGDKWETISLQQGVSLSVVRDSHCDLKEQDTVDVFGTLIEGVPCVIPSKCSCNLGAACAIRAGFERSWDKEENRKFSKFFRTWCTKIFGQIEVGEVDFEEWLCRYPISKRRDLEFALTQELGVMSSTSSMFVKDEAYVGKTRDNFKPRKIECRTDEYLARLGPWFWKLSKIIKRKLPHKYYYTSGATAKELGDWFASTEDTFAVEIDYSNWDGSMTPWDIQNEIWFLENIVTDKPDGWDIFKRDWKRYVATGAKGRVVYKSFYGRRSGDVWTSLFNSIFNLALSTYLVPDLSSCCACGDDGVVNTTVVNTREAIAKAKRLGRTIDFFVKPREEIEFCSGRFWKVNGETIWGVKPFRALAKFGINYNKHNKENQLRILRGMCLSMLPIGNHVPVFGDFLRRVIFLTEGKRALFKSKWTADWTFNHGSIYNTSSDTVSQFEHLYGCSDGSVENAIKHINTLTLKDFPIVWTGSLFKYGGFIDVAEKAITEDHFIGSAQMKPTNSAQVLPVLLLIWPFLEEVAKNLNPLYGPVLGLAELLLGGSVLNVLFHSTTFLLPFWIRVAVHYGINLIGAQTNSLALMTNKKNSRGRRQGKAKKSKGGSRNPPGSWKKVLGEIIKYGGTTMGTALGGPAGGIVGGAGADLFNRITGMGTYKIRSNTLFSDNQPTLFKGDNGKIRVKHSEFLDEITGSQSFAQTVYSLNPGLSNSFPWLSSLAQAYETYEVKGMVYHYKPTSGTAVGSTNTALGVVVMATHYDAEAPAFASRREMESYMYTTSCVPCDSMLHPIECDPSSKVLREQYIRYGTTTDNLRWDDLGKMTIATEGMQADNVALGELWVTYDVELIKPRIQNSGYGTAKWGHLTDVSYSDTNPLNDFGLVDQGTLGMTVGGELDDADRLVFPPELDHGYFLVACQWTGSSTASLGINADPTNGTNLFVWNGGSNSLITNNSTTSTDFMAMWVIEITGKNCYITFSGETLPTSPVGFDVFVAQIGPGVAPVLPILTHNSLLRQKTDYLEEEKEDYYMPRRRLSGRHH